MTPEARARRARLRAIVANASDRVAPAWPLASFVAVTPLLGFEHLPFESALARASELFRADVFPAEAAFRAAYAERRIRPADLLDAVNADLARHGERAWIPAGDRRIDVARFRIAGLLGTFSEAAGEELDRPRRDVLERLLLEGARRSGGGLPTARVDGGRDDVAAIGVRDTLADFCDRRGIGGGLLTELDRRVGTWLAAFFDEGEAAIPMPHRSRGFFAAWRRLAPHENALAGSAAAHRAALAALPPRAEDVLLDNLTALGIPESRWTGYLERSLLQQPGWAGFVKRAAAADPSPRPAIDLVALLAVRTWYERRLVGAAVRRALGIPATFPALRERLRSAPAAPAPPAGDARDLRLLAAIVADLDLPLDAANALDPIDARVAVAAVRDLDAVCRSAIWLEAGEIAYRRSLLATLAAAPAPPPAAPAPEAQAVFCIDVRSEPFRRALEAEGPYATLGFAGFFGFPVRHVGPEGTATDLCPVLMTPKHAAQAPGPGPAAAAARALRRVLAAALHAAEGHPVGAFAMVELLGLPAAAAALRRTFLPRAVRQAARPPAEPALAMTVEEQAFYAEAALRVMGLTSGFAPLVLLCGHGGATVNNAFAAALDCGACGGHRGFVSARVAASALNRPDVRERLAERGIAIPDGTWFVAGEHDTTRDAVALAGPPPPGHAGAFVRLEAALARAGARTRRERGARLPAAPLGSGDPIDRASDWAQVRPEWGLARNAAFIVAPRVRSLGCDLGGRAFLHSYDPHADLDGAVLEQILTAPLVVAEWINLHYYFATVDPERFGSGEKMLQQPVGRIGVVLGNHGDVRPALPWQSLAAGPEPYHEPQRLLAVVCAPTHRIDAIVARQGILQRLFQNRWVHLVAIDPDDGRAAIYRGARTWEPYIPRPEEERVWNLTV